MAWDNNKDYEKASHIAQHSDIVAIQEMRNEDALGVLYEKSARRQRSKRARPTLALPPHRELTLWVSSRCSITKGWLGRLHRTEIVPA